MGKVQPSTAAVVTLERDTHSGKPNGFVSNDSPLISFSDSMGSDLAVADFSPQSIGQELAVFGDDPSSLLINFSSPVNFLSLVFGND